MTTKTRLDDLTERVGRLERKAENVEAGQVALMQALTLWMNGINAGIAAMSEAQKTLVADIAELGQHVRGKLGL